jgi:hypothetical protein
MIDTETTGVLAHERDRQQKWADLDLPDPVRVEAEENATERMTGDRWRSPKRAQLDAYFTDNPDARPPGWDD